MSGFAGNGPSTGRSSRFAYIATAGQTVFSGPDRYGLTLKNNGAPWTEVVLNGSWLQPSDYTVTDASTITFSTPLLAGDEVYIFCLSVFSAVDGLSITQNGADILSKPTFRANLGAQATLTPGHLAGEPSNGNAAVGEIGEFLTSVGGTGLSSGTNANITSLSLTAGDWDVWGNINFAGTGSTTVVQMTAGISTTSAVLPTTPANGYMRLTSTVNAGQADNTFALSPFRLSLSATTTVYLVAQAIITASTLNAICVLNARRAR